MTPTDEQVERVARAIWAVSFRPDTDDNSWDGQGVSDETRDGVREEARAAIAAMGAALPPQVSPELIEKLGKLANYLTEQGEYEACDLIDTVVERLTPKAKG